MWGHRTLFISEIITNLQHRSIGPSTAPAHIPKQQITTPYALATHWCLHGYKFTAFNTPAAQSQRTQHGARPCPKATDHLHVCLMVLRRYTVHTSLFQ